MAPLSRENSLSTKTMGGPQPLEIAFSFDTTGSMGGCIAKVREQVQQIMERLSSDIPSLRMAVFAHGDYCDKHNYVTKWHDFTTNVKDLCDFVRNVGGTSGGDYPECYELVLKQVREELSWTTGTQRSLVMIGDAIPHEKNDPQNTQKIDWNQEVDRLYNEMGVKIYSVQCNNNPTTATFFKSLAEKTNGTHLLLEKFETIIDIMMSIVYREQGAEYFEEYEKEVRAREGAAMRWELDRMLNRLANRDGETSAEAPVIPSPTVAKVAPLRGSSTAKLGESTDKIATSATRPDKTAKKPALRRIRDGPVKKRTPKKVKRMSLNKEAIKRKLRESVTDNHMLNWLKWTGWKQAMTAEVPTRNPLEWKPRSANSGFRRVGLFEENNKPSIYEIAVQESGDNSKVPVWRGYTNGFKGKNWDTYFLKNENLSSNMEDVLQKGCKLYVRRTQQFVKADMFHCGTTASTLEEANKLIANTYDYAWGGPTSTHRQLFLRRSRRSSVVPKQELLRRSKRKCVIAKRNKPY